ncbi:DUF5018 domain-containing protein [Paenibacillus flagellatus]|uniref:Uncharacterized protein n=1 Tax=Paenibacillus flagellatus TaxID=2211139 RepID=A0A2V5KAB2_9BACL|nr:DUF5018 domain-containing protein [Paenibacillus flagellatus]PYI56378.1 hypothetical protein DLM86_05200 [Paenibacillus flagellatus]
MSRTGKKRFVPLALAAILLAAPFAGVPAGAAPSGAPTGRGETPAERAAPPAAMAENAPSAVLQTVPSVPPTPPSSHPRLFVRTADDIAELKAKLATELMKPAWKAVQANAARSNADPDVIKAKAMMYVLGEGEAYGRQAVSLFDGYVKSFRDTSARGIGHMLVMGAIVYDWCYPLLSEANKTEWNALFQSHAEKMEIGYPPDAQGAISGHGAEDQLLRDQLSWAIAVYDERPDVYGTVAGRLFERYVPVRNWYYGSGMHHRGDSYGPGTMASDYVASLLFKKMSGIDLFGPSQRDVMYHYLYARRPDGSLLRNGDSYEDDQHPYGQYWRNSWPWMTSASLWKDPYLQGEFLRNYAGADGTGAIEAGKLDPVLELLYADPFVEAKPTSDLPLTRYFGSPHGSMIARTGWTAGMDAGSSDVVADVRMNETFFSGHQHLDAGAFQLYYKGALAIDSGNYALYESPHHMNYSRRTIAHNAMLVYDPDEKPEWHDKTPGTYEDPFDGGKPKPLVNDGGQFWPNQAYEPYDLADIQNPDKGYTGRGGVTAVQFGPDRIAPNFSYIKGDLTNHYSDKVEDYSRSFVFLNLKNGNHPAAVVVRDRVTASNAAFKKTWLLHSIQPPVIDGDTTTIVRDADGYDGKLVNTTLLPHEATIVAVGGPGKEFADYEGTNWPETRNVTSSSETGAWRVEVSPKEAAATDSFLNVMQVMDTGTEPLPVQGLDSEKMEGVRIADRAVWFAKSGSKLDERLRLDVGGPEAGGEGGLVQVVVTDLAAGVWKVDGAANTEAVVTEEGGALYFSGPAGSYTIRPTGKKPSPSADIVSFRVDGQVGEAAIDTSARKVTFHMPYGTDMSKLTPRLGLSEGATSQPASGESLDFAKPVKVKVRSSDGKPDNWTIEGVVDPPSGAKAIVQFVVDGQTAPAVIDHAARTIAFRMPYGTDVSALAPTIEPSPNASVSPPSGTARHFGAPVVYTVTAQDGTKTDYTVTCVLDPPGAEKSILSFVVPGQTGAATIDTAARTVTFTMPADADITALAPDIAVSPGAAVSPASGTPADFTSPVVYTVTAQDGSTASWTVSCVRSDAFFSTTAWSPIPLGAGHTGKVKAEFDLTPLKELDPNGVNSLLGYADGSAVVGQYPDIPISIYFNPESKLFQVRNGGTWAHANPIPIVVDRTYRFRLIVDFASSSYSVWVTPEGGRETVLYENAAFRTGASPIDDLGQLLLKSIGEDRSFKVERHTVVPAAGADEWMSAAGFAESAYSLGKPYAGKVHAEFDLTMLADITDQVGAIVGYESFGADDATMAYSKIPVSLYFNPGDPPVFLTKNGTRTSAEHPVPIEKGKTYRFKFDIDTAAKTYSVSVMPEGGAETSLLTNGSFRANADPIEDVGKVYLKTLGMDEVFTIRNHTITNEEAGPPLGLAKAAAAGTSTVDDVTAVSASKYALVFDAPLGSIAPSAFRVQRYADGGWIEYAQAAAAAIDRDDPRKAKLALDRPIGIDAYQYRLIAADPALVRSASGRPWAVEAGAAIPTSFDRVAPTVVSASQKTANGALVPNTFELTFSERIVAFDKADFELRDETGAALAPGSYSVERTKPDTLEFVVDAPSAGTRTIAVGWPNAASVQDAGGAKPAPSAQAAVVALTVVERPAPGGTTVSRIWAANDGEIVKRDDLDHPAANGNSAWDGASVKLFGGRNEVLAFQVVVEAGTKGIGALTASLPELRREGGGGVIAYAPPVSDPTLYAGRPIQLFVENYMNVTEATKASWIVPASGVGSRPDGLGAIPVQLVPENASPGKGGFPVTVGAMRNQAIWIEVYTDPGLPAGKYEGTVTVVADGVEHPIPVELELFDFTLPDTNSVDVMLYYEGAQVEAYEGTNRDDAYHRLAHRNRVEFVHGYDPERMTAAIGRFDGSDFTPSRGYEGPGEGVGNRLAPRTFYGPGTLFDTSESAWRQADEWLSYLNGTFGEGAKKTFAYMPDEPADPATFAYIRKLSANLKSNPGIGRDLPVFVTSGYNAELDEGNAVDIWDATPSHYDPKRALLERAHGDDMWIYNGSRPFSGAPVYETPATDSRANVWAAFKHDIDTYFYWHVNNWRHNSQMWPGMDRHQNVWLEPVTFRNREPSYGNGDGVLVYPGRNVRFPSEDRGIDGPISSIRLANLRRGAQDHLYMTMLRERGREDAVDEALARVVPDILPGPGRNVLGFAESGDAYESARYALAQALAATPDAKVPVISVAGDVAVLLPGETTAAKELAFTATAVDRHGAAIRPTVRLNGAVLAPEPAGSDSYRASLQEGANVLTIDAVDADGLAANTRTYAVNAVSTKDRLVAIVEGDGATVALDRREAPDEAYAGVAAYRLYDGGVALTETAPLGSRTALGAAKRAGETVAVRLYGPDGAEHGSEDVTLQAPETGWLSRTTFLESRHWLGAGHDGTVAAQFDVTPLHDNIDGVVGYADTSTDVDGFGKLAVLVRLNADGTFDARDGDGYGRDAVVRYRKGETYRVRLAVDVAARTYDVWIVSPDGTETRLAAGYRFRTGAAPLDDVGQIVVVSTLLDGSFRIDGHSVGRP